MPNRSDARPSPPSAWRRLVQGLVLRDARRAEEQSPADRLAAPEGRPLVDLLVVGGAVAALAAGALFLSAGPTFVPATRTAGLRAGAMEQPAPAPDRR